MSGISTRLAKFSPPIGPRLTTVLDPTTLRLFIAVCEEGTIARAAEREFIAASAISKRIADVEERIDTALLSRRQRGVAPTAAGNVLLSQARAILRRLSDLEAELGQHANGVRGHVRIVANVSSIVEFLPDELAQFLALHDRISLDLEERSSADVVRSVSGGLADIGVCRETGLLNGLDTRRLRNDRLVLLVHESHPLAHTRSIAYADTLTFEHIGVPLHAAILDTMQCAAAKANRELRFRVKVSSFEAALRMIQSGIGVGVLPQEAAQRYMTMCGLHAVSLVDRWAELGFIMCTREVCLLSPAARLVFEHLHAQLGAFAGIAVRDGLHRQ